MKKRLASAIVIGATAAVLVATYHVMLVPLLGRMMAIPAVLVLLLGTALLLDQLGLYGPRRRKKER